MKKNLLSVVVCMTLLNVTQIQAQCPSTFPVPKFNGTPTLVPNTGSALQVNAVYRYSNVLTSPFNIDALVKIEAINNAQIVLLDNNAVAPDRFQPQIKPSPNLPNSTREGWVQWSVTFVIGGTNTPTNIAQLYMTLYDVDGNGTTNGNRFQETGWVTGHTTGNLNAPTEINSQNGVVSNSITWSKINGSLTEHNSVSSDPEVAALFLFNNKSVIQFRQGYKYTHVSGGAPGTPDFREYSAEFTCFVFPNPGPLPLSFKNFSVAVNDRRAKLYWTTFNEINVQKFEIERSDDGYAFKTVGIALPDGGRNTTTDYEFPDDLSTVNGSVAYYRIKSVDKDGRAIYSNVISTRIGVKSKNDFSISPVPASNNAVIRMYAPTGGTAFLRITDVNGRTMMQQQQKVVTGNNIISLNNLSALVNGTYFVQIGINGDVYNERLLIQR
jgi:hypothetical protein